MTRAVGQAGAEVESPGCLGVAAARRVIRESLRDAGADLLGVALGLVVAPRPRRQLLAVTGGGDALDAVSARGRRQVLASKAQIAAAAQRGIGIAAGERLVEVAEAVHKHRPEDDEDDKGIPPAVEPDHEAGV